MHLIFQITYSKEDQIKIMHAGEIISNGNLVMEDASDDTIESIYEKCTSYYGFDFVVIDGIDNIRSSNDNSLDSIGHRIRDISCVCDCPLVVTKKLDKEVNKMLDNREPVESIIKKLAKNNDYIARREVWLLDREDFYTKNSGKDNILNLYFCEWDLENKLPVIQGDMYFDNYSRRITG